MAMGDKAAEKRRTRLATRSQPFLPAGSEVRQAFMGQTGPNPLFFLLTYLILFWIRYRIVCVTDEGIYVLKSGMLAKPKELLATLPRQSQLGPVSGLWSKVNLGGQQVWVHRQFHKEIQAADAARVATTA
jgi:hypothetical protein